MGPTNPNPGGLTLTLALALTLRLEVQVYSGADGEFVLSEDDGESLDYQRGGGSSTHYSRPPRPCNST